MVQSNSKSTRWKEVISPKNSLFNLGLKDVWAYKDLIVLFVKRDFTTQFKQTILGPIWHIIQPVLTTVMFLILFKGIAKIPVGDLPAPLFYLSGIALWNYFSTCITSTASTFTANASIFGKVYFPRLVLPISVIISNLLKFSIQLLLLFLVSLYYYFTHKYKLVFTGYILMIPILVIILAGISLGVGIIISSLTTKYRDFVILINFGVQLLMYVTPIAFPLSYVQNPLLRTLLKINPLTSLVEGFRFAIFRIGTFQVGDLLYSLIFMLVSLLLGITIFNKVEKTFMDTV